jgi:UDP-N-acetylmuramoyl-tripeptide--D-alanyl-D-alanine ligase
MTKKKLWTAEDILSATNGTLIGKQNWSGNKLCLDSREIQKDDIFVAYRGEKVDGHNFIESAFKNGAIAAIVEAVPEKKEHSYVYVKQSEEALLNIGNYARNRLEGKVIGVTGSVGKTSTKDMIAQILSEQAPTNKSQRSFNSLVGLPIALSGCNPSYAYNVLELGMTSSGEISTLARMARPHIAIITMIAPSHLEFFDSIEGIAKAKAEIFDGVPSYGTAIIRGDIPETPLLIDSAKEKGIQKIITFGESKDCDYHILEYIPGEQFNSLRAKIGKDEISFKLSTPGKHWALNALASLAAVKAVGADVQKASEALITYNAPDRRGKPIFLDKNILLVDESYNANPASVEAALDSFGERKVKGKKIAVLGDMRELGPSAPDLHVKLEKPIKKSKTDLLFLYGPLMEHLYKSIKKDIKTYYFKDIEELNKKLISEVKRDDAIMVKASLGTGFKIIVDALLINFEKKN